MSIKNNRCFIIAEAGVNHNGDIRLAKELIDVASKAGADAIKFQTFKADQLVSIHAKKADYQLKLTDKHESQFEMIQKLELSPSDHETLIDYAKHKKTIFLSSPFDTESLWMLTEKFKLETIKVPSGEITNAPFLLEVSRKAKNIILSTGMCLLSEVEKALGVIAFGFSAPSIEIPTQEKIEKAFSSNSCQQQLRERVILLHCTTEYPAPFDEINLRAMDTLRKAFGLRVGYSDHTQGIHISLAAVARGACMIEKHFTLDRNLPGPDHQASLEPKELCNLVQQIREIESALGDGVKRPTSSEWKNRAIARKSLVAAKNILKGDVFTEDNVTCKRPGDGVSPFLIWKMLGQSAKKNYVMDELLD